MLIPRRPLRIRCPSALLHTTAVRYDLVGPIHPISHLRPVIYDDAPPALASDTRHPYSLSEFSDTGDPREYQWKIQRQELDTFNQAFWEDSNARFEDAQRAVLSGLPKTATAMDREVVLSNFYRDWLVQEADRQAAYSAEWGKRNWSNILLGARVFYQKLRSPRL